MGRAAASSVGRDIACAYPIIAAAEREACAEFVLKNCDMDPDDPADAIRAGGHRDV